MMNNEEMKREKQHETQRYTNKNHKLIFGVGNVHYKRNPMHDYGKQN